MRGLGWRGYCCVRFTEMRDVGFIRACKWGVKCLQLGAYLIAGRECYAAAS